MMQKPGDLPGRRLQLFLNASRKGVRAAVGIRFRRKDPVASLSLSRGRKVDGFLFFLPTLACADNGGALDSPANPKRRRATLAAALQVLSITLLIVIGMTSCFNPHEKSANTETHEVTDEAGRHLRLPIKVERIVSLAPNLTEIVYAVGAGNRLVGDTEYCDYPAEAKSVPKVGDTMKPSVERIVALKPDVVLVSTASQLEAFAQQLNDQKIAVYVTDPHNLDAVFRSIENLGDLFGEHDRAATLAANLRQRTTAVEAAMKPVTPLKVFYQVSNEPLYTIGRDGYLTDLVRRAGGVSVTADVPGAFPRFSDEAALAAMPDAIILPTGSSAMGTANSTVARALQNSPAVRNNRIYKVNDDHLSRPGPRLIEGLEEMARALHPEAFKQSQ